MIFGKKYDISGKFFSTSRKFLSFAGKNVICPENFDPPLANISGGKI